MKKVIITIILILFAIPVYAESINPVVYKQMQLKQYQNNKSRQQKTNQVPYWQAQSNYSTRNKIYNNNGNTNYNYYQYLESSRSR